jgi:cell division protein FtsW (lipid II flippase)
LHAVYRVARNCYLRLNGEALIEIIVEFIVQVLIEVFGEIVLHAAFSKRAKASFAMASLGYAILGALLAALSVWAYPHRFSQNDGLSILGVFANALLVGVAMQFHGERRRKQGKQTTHLATFWGGALFALSFAGTRLAILIATH